VLSKSSGLRERRRVAPPLVAGTQKVAYNALCPSPAASGHDASRPTRVCRQRRSREAAAPLLRQSQNHRRRRHAQATTCSRQVCRYPEHAFPRQRPHLDRRTPQDGTAGELEDCIIAVILRSQSSVKNIRLEVSKLLFADCQDYCQD